MNYKETTLRTLAKLYLKFVLQITVQLYPEKAIQILLLLQHIVLLIIYGLQVSFRAIPKVKIREPSKMNNLDHTYCFNMCKDF